MATKTRSVAVRGVCFRGKNKDGDFAWMVKQQQYKDSLFIVMENFLDMMSDEQIGGGGTACLRPLTYNAMSADDILDLKVPRATGIPTGWSTETRGFPELLKYYSQRCIDLALERAIVILHTYPSITEVIYSCDEKHPELIGSGIFSDSLGDDVVSYISSKIVNLGKLPPTTWTFDKIMQHELRLMPYALVMDKCARQERELAKRPRASSASTANTSSIQSFMAPLRPQSSFHPMTSAVGSKTVPPPFALRPPQMPMGAQSKPMPLNRMASLGSKRAWESR